MGFDLERQVMSQGGTTVDEIVKERARRAVAMRVEMTAEERYDLLEMLGLVKEAGVSDDDPES